MNHPMQDIELDDHGTPRFRANKIVQYLLDNGPFDMNDLSRLFGGGDEPWLRLCGFQTLIVCVERA